MSKAETRDAIVDTDSPAEVERFIAGASAQVLDDPEAVSRAIVHDILSAPTIDEVFRRRELTHARDVLGEPITVLDVRWMKGDYDTEGPGFYAVMDAASADGEKVQVSCGARNVMAQLWRLRELDAFPIQVAIVESGRTTAAGYKPMTLEPANAF
jgi:hypothetical protein